MSALGFQGHARRLLLATNPKYTTLSDDAARVPSARQTDSQSSEAERDRSCLSSCIAKLARLVHRKEEDDDLQSLLREDQSNSNGESSYSGTTYFGTSDS
jgi:hypothetical protein